MMMIRVEKKNAMANRLGSWKNRIFAIEDSKSPMIPERMAHFRTKRTSRNQKSACGERGRKPEREDQVDEERHEEGQLDGSRQFHEGQVPA